MRRMLLAVLVVLGLVMTASVGHAASMAVTSRSNLAFKAQHPCPGTASAVPATGTALTYSAVKVTFPAACAGRAVSVTVHNAAGTALRTGTGTAASGQTLVTFSGSFTMAAGVGIRATVQGWHMPTTWLPAVSCRIPANPAQTCTATVTTGGLLWATYYEVAVTSPSTTGVVWELTFNFADPLLGGPPDDLRTPDPVVGVSAVPCTELPLYTLQGTGALATVSASTPRAFTLRENSILGGTLLMNC